MVNQVGCEFRPYEDDLVAYYLRLKNQGQNSLVEGAISEIDICSFDPWDLRFQSKTKSRDRYWYFFSRIENKYAKGNKQNRTTPSGQWKLTGKPVDVEDQWGFYTGVPQTKIGHKRYVQFNERNSEKTNSSWTMQEFHCDLVEEHQRNYVICRLEYTGNDQNILFDNPTHPTVFPNATNSEGSVVDRSIRENSVSSNYPNECVSANQFPQRLWDYEINKDIGFYFIQNHSAHCPKPPVTGVFTDDSSDSDSDTDSMTCGDTESVSSSDEPYNSPIHNTPSLNTLDPLPNYEAQEQPKQLISTEKSESEWKMAEDLIMKTPSSITVKQNWIVLDEMSHMDSQWNYLKNVFIGFLLLVCIIGWIILV